MNLVLQFSLLLLFYNRHPFRSQCWSSLIVASLLIEPLVQGLEMHGPQHSAALRLESSSFPLTDSKNDVS